MKKTLKYIIALVIGSMIFTSCDNPYDNQTVALPGNYSQVKLQDTTGFAAVLKAGLSPLTISTTSLTSPLSLLTCSTVLSRVDTTTRLDYRLDFSNVSTFANYKTIAITFDGKAGSDVKVGCKEFNDSIKKYNKNAVQRTVYIRLISFIKKNGLNAGFTSKILSLLVTPNNYPPVALNDVATLSMNSSLNINVLGNDTDPEGDALKVTTTTTPAHGTTAINTDGTIKYTPKNGFSGTDSFGYTISDGNGNTSTANVDITILAVNPFSAVTVRPWFLIGAAIGDGNWNNSTSGLGVSIFPLSVVTGNVYNSTGDGQFTYTGYLQAGKGFKLIRDYFSTTVNWNESWGMTGTTYVHDGGDNITVAADGYYTISLNSIVNTLTIVPTPASSIPTGSFAPMALSGDFNGWSSTANPMTAVNSTNNHQWYTTVNLTSPNGLKFNSKAWTTSWGSNDFPVGIGTSSNGPNIPDVVGKYTVLFNDIDGSYYFIKVQ
jgi:hypothetical protein